MAARLRKPATRRAKSRTSPTRKKSPAKEIEVPFKPTPDFRFLPSTGALVRADLNTTVITFYVDDSTAVSQLATLEDYDEEHTTYRSGLLKEEYCRWLQVAVAKKGATAIVEQAYTNVRS